MRARAGAVATAVRRALSDGIVYGVGVVAAVLAALTALVCVTGCSAPPPVNGTIAVRWSILASNGPAISCESAGGRFVALRIRDRAAGTVTAASFPCPAGRGTVQLTPGLYDIAIQLDGTDGNRLAVAPDQNGVAVVSGQIAQLALVSLRLGTAEQTSLVLSIATSAATNCRPQAAGGAGITGTSITLEHTGGDCAPVIFTRQLGGTYTVSCISPAVTSCVEKDDTLTTQLDPGSYLLRVRGKIGALDCWTRDDTIVIPAGGGTVSRTLGLLRITGMGCPP